MKLNYKIYLLTSLISLFISSCSQESDIERTITEKIKGRDLTLGVSVFNSKGKKLVDINSDARFAMQSVYKLPIALAYLENGTIDWGDSIQISKEQLLPNTWSPFREAYPNGATISVIDFVHYVVAKSDNNLCDVMIDKAGGISKIQEFIVGYGVDSLSIQNYEREIKASWDIQFDNWATPNGAIKLLQKIWLKKKQGSQVSEKLWQVMSSTQTGSARKLLSEETIIGYKTGFSGKSTNKVTAANNCIGIIENPNGEDIFFAIFIGNYSESEEYNYSLIAEIVKLLD